jgi:DNA-binding NarL/FixJ family response regulator
VSSTVLIVDDSVAIRRSLRSCIEREGEMTVCGEAENGAIAVEKVRELSPDVVILDLQMPVMNGLEAARAIAAMAPQTAMVMLTLHTHDALASEAQAAGIREVLSKTDAVPGLLLASLKRLRA